MLNEMVRLGEAYWTREGGVAWVLRVFDVGDFHPYAGVMLKSHYADVRGALHLVEISSWTDRGVWFDGGHSRLDLVARVCASPSFPHPSTCPRWYDERKRTLARECNNGEEVLYG